jgi:acylphosphatase
MSETCLLARVCGRVQGVSFRYHTQNQALALGLRGWVRNMPDGSVEACICGNPEHIKAMQQWLRHGPAHATISSINFETSELSSCQPGFHIL